MPCTFDRYQPATDETALRRMMSLAFTGTPDSMTPWLINAGNDNFRVMRDAATRAAKSCLLRIPMGQYFGGKSVPMVGIAGVAVPPEERGQGLARTMMAAGMQELAAEGVALSGLYASTQSLYRQVGFEQAGHWFRTRLPWAVLQGLGEFVPVRPLTDADFPAVQACYAKYAKTFNGMLDRGSYIWNRVRLWRDVPYQGFAIWNDANEIEGYLYLSQTRLPSGRQEIALSDHAFLTPRAGQGLLRFLSDFTMMAEEITLNAGPIAPLVSLMPQQRYVVERREYSMLRITNLPAAIAARGYSPHVRAEFTLDVSDQTVSSNAGLWRVTVRDGQGTAEPAARGTNPASCVGLDIRALAAIYSGFYSASQARLLGWVTGPADSLRSVDAVFSGSTPWMTDMF